jgi:hypothetical protein
MSTTNSSLTFSSNCDSDLYNELNNTYQIICSYQLICGEEKEFNYTDGIKIWHKDKWCYKATVPNEWKMSKSEEILIK